MNALDDVSYVAHPGYAVQEIRTNANNNQAEPQVDDEGNPIPQQQDQPETKEKISMKMRIQMKGDSFEMDQIGEQEAKKK